MFIILIRRLYEKILLHKTPQTHTWLPSRSFDNCDGNLMQSWKYPFALKPNTIGLSANKWYIKIKNRKWDGSKRLRFERPFRPQLRLAKTDRQSGDRQVLLCGGLAVLSYTAPTCMAAFVEVREALHSPLPTTSLPRATCLMTCQYS